jgi:hypothetical protein
MQRKIIMNKLFLTGFLIFFSFTEMVFGQGTATATPAEKEILDLEIKWMNAVAKKDSLVIESLLAKDFELSKIGGSAKTNIQRKKWVDNYMGMEWGRFAFKGMQIRVDSNLATVNSILSFRIKPYPFRLSSGVLDIWRKNDGRWQVEKRYLSQDNLSEYMQITEGIAIGIVFLIVFRWIRSMFRSRTEPKTRVTEN